MELASEPTVLALFLAYLASSSVMSSSSEKSESESFGGTLDGCGDGLMPRARKLESFPVEARSKPRYGAEGFIGREMYSGWYCTPT